MSHENEQTLHYMEKNIVKSVKNWSVFAIPGQIGAEFEQKQHLCALFSWKSHENEQTLHNLEESQLNL
jgi:hypothetical protein